MSALKYWVWLSALPGLSNVNKLQLLFAFSSPEELYYAAPEEVYGVEGLKKEQADALNNKSLEAAEKILGDCARENVFIVTMADALYPNRLRNMYDPPLMLYGKGNMPLFDEEVALAMVGTRKCTPYGVQCAEELGYELVRQGAMVVSGMAKGIDGAALKGALRGGGFPCAVLGGGVDVIYPKENEWLYQDIIAAGVVLSEYAPGTEPLSRHFPVRNRIISGLTLGTVVVEAPERSGALITAHTALEQGRDVFAVPGSIHVPTSAGCHQLIREGAALVQCAWDVLEEYQDSYPHKLHRLRGKLPPMPRSADMPESKEAEKANEVNKVDEAEPASQLPTLDLRKGNAGLTDDQIAILHILPTDMPLLADETAERTGISIRRALSALTVLEIDGYAEKCGAQSFISKVIILDKE